MVRNTGESRRIGAQRRGFETKNVITGEFMNICNDNTGRARAEMPTAFKAVTQKEIHENAVNHGWWEDKRPIPELLCLVHSEISEALEAYRKHDDEHVAEELADAVIRIMDMCEAYEINLEEEIRKKHEINKGRPYRHGNKRC